MPPLRAVLLDLGGVFYLPDHDRVVNAFTRVDVAVERDRLDEAHYHSVAAIERYHADGRDAAELSGLGIWHAYNRAYAHACGVHAEAVDLAAAHLLEEFQRAPMWTRVVPGARAALRQLADLGVGLAMVSNADGTVEAQLRTDRICQVGEGAGVPVAVILDSSVVGVSKPDPAIFALALEALDVTPAEAVHVGDTPAADVAGARAAGVTPLLVDPFDLHADVGCDRVRDLSEVPGWVRARRAG